MLCPRSSKTYKYGYIHPSTYAFVHSTRPLSEKFYPDFIKPCASLSLVSHCTLKRFDLSPLPIFSFLTRCMLYTCYLPNKIICYSYALSVQLDFFGSDVECGNIKSTCLAGLLWCFWSHKYHYSPCWSSPSWFSRLRFGSAYWIVRMHYI